jgi:hypothetical protein
MSGSDRDLTNVYRWLAYGYGRLRPALAERWNLAAEVSQRARLKPERENRPATVEQPQLQRV